MGKLRRAARVSGESLHIIEQHVGGRDALRIALDAPQVLAPETWLERLLPGHPPLPGQHRPLGVAVRVTDVDTHQKSVEL